MSLNVNKSINFIQIVVALCYIVAISLKHTMKTCYKYAIYQCSTWNFVYDCRTATCCCTKEWSILLLMIPLRIVILSKYSTTSFFVHVLFIDNDKSVILFSLRNLNRIMLVIYRTLLKQTIDLYVQLYGTPYKNIDLILISLKSKSLLVGRTTWKFLMLFLIYQLNMCKIHLANMYLLNILGIFLDIVNEHSL